MAAAVRRMGSASGTVCFGANFVKDKLSCIGTRIHGDSAS
jgi:hypothetical protein